MENKWDFQQMFTRGDVGVSGSSTSEVQQNLIPDALHIHKSTRGCPGSASPLISIVAQARHVIIFFRKLHKHYRCFMIKAVEVETD